MMDTNELDQKETLEKATDWLRRHAASTESTARFAEMLCAELDRLHLREVTEASAVAQLAELRSQLEAVDPDKLDGKFRGIIIKIKDGTIVPPDDYVVFLAHDDAFPAALTAYRSACEVQGAEALQLRAVDQLIERVAQWRGDHPGLCKVPDVRPGELLGTTPAELSEPAPQTIDTNEKQEG